MKKDRNERTEEQGQFLDNAEAFRDYILSQTRRALAEVFEQELSALCGERYGHSADSDYCRAGSAPSYVMTEGGRKRCSAHGCEKSMRTVVARKSH